MAKYSLYFIPGPFLYDIPDDDKGYITGLINEGVNEVLGSFKSPTTILMNSMAYSMFCSSISRKKESQTLICPKSTRG